MRFARTGSMSGRMAPSMVEADSPLMVACSTGLTPLHVAAKNGHRQVVEVLLELRAPLNVQTHLGETPLHLAAMNGHEAVVAQLLRGGADGSIEDSAGELAMNYAEYRGYDGLASQLVPHSLRPSATPDSIFDAIDERDMVQMPLLLGALSANVTSRGTYPLHYALSRRQVDMVPMLIDAGADVTLRSSKGSQPLHIAACKGLEAAARQLLRHGADVNDRNPANGWTPMHYAIGKAMFGMVHLLMQNGADPLLANRQGRTCLDLALNAGGRDLISAMMAGGLLKRVKADLLLQYAVQARRFSLALVVSMMGKGSWAPVVEMSRFANAAQIRIMIERDKAGGVALLKETIEKNNSVCSWAALDSM